MGAALLAAGFPIAASAGCEDIKKKIEDQLLIKEIANYSLEIVPADTDPGDAKVVGTCDGGKSKILYSRPAKATEPMPAQ
ncbi:MAG TPA: DUF1161 domain-containing protein [Nevskiaceae bacterium]|nr:DUF1161 domain-containing protein [Nevskiaceae bacterium]